MASYLEDDSLNSIANNMRTGDRYIVDEDDFSFGSKVKECCDIYDFENDIEEKEKILKYELKTNASFSKGWKKAIEIANDLDSQVLSEYELLSVVTYTLEDPPVYKEFNEQVREFNVDDDDFEYQGMHFFLHSAINKLSADGGPYHVYRGVTHKIKAKKGDKFHFDSFASASQNLNVARSFGTQSRPGYTGEEYECITMFDISNTNKGASIEDYSEFPESEVVIPPCEEFIVIKIEEELIETYQIDGTKKKLKTKIIHLETIDDSDSSDSD